MILPDPWNGDKLGKGPGTERAASPAPSLPKPSLPWRPQHSHGTAAPGAAAEKGPTAASREYFQVLRKGSQGPTTVGEERWVRHDCHSPSAEKTFFPSFLVDLLPNYIYFYGDR